MSFGIDQPSLYKVFNCLNGPSPPRLQPMIMHSQLAVLDPSRTAIDNGPAGSGTRVIFRCACIVEAIFAGRKHR